MYDRRFREEPRRSGFGHEFGRRRPDRYGASAPALRRQPIAGPPVGATVKWFSPQKGFGFVALDDGSGEAFLHASVVEQWGGDGSALQPGAALQVRVGQGQKGAQVSEIVGLDESRTAAAAPPRTGGRRAPPRAVPERVTGTVKWYSPERGFGFVAIDSGQREVFVHATTLQRSRVAALREGQRVTLEVAEGRKGLEAVAVTAAE